jgi:hypothetical protein
LREKFVHRSDRSNSQRVRIDSGFLSPVLVGQRDRCNLDDDRYYGKKIISETECERNLVTFFQLSGVHSSRHLPTESFCFLMEQIVSVFKRQNEKPLFLSSHH